MPLTTHDDAQYPAEIFGWIVAGEGGMIIKHARVKMSGHSDMRVSGQASAAPWRGHPLPGLGH